MKREKDVERMIAVLRAEPGADAKKRILADAAAAFAQAMETTSRRASEPRRMDMIHRHMRGLVAAAAAAALALVGMFLWMTGGAKPAMSAYAQVSEAASNTKSAEWVHMVSTLSGSMGDMLGGRIEQWISLNPSRLAIKRPEGLMFVDRANNKEYRYDYATKTIKVGTASDFPGGVESTSDLFSDFMRSLDKMQKNGNEVVTKKGARTIDGVSYDLYTCTNAGDNKIEEILVDPVARRIARFDTAGPGYSTSLVIDYPATGPEDIYALGAPRDAKVVEEGQAPAAGGEYVIVPATGMGPLKWGMTAEEAQAAIGPAEKVTDTVPGKVVDLRYLSKGFTLTIYQTGGLKGIACLDRRSAVLFAVNAETFAGRTAEGIAIDSTEGAITAAYGQPDNRDTRGEMAYLSYNHRGLFFTLENGKVAQFSVNAPRPPRTPWEQPRVQATEGKTN